MTETIQTIVLTESNRLSLCRAERKAYDTVVDKLSTMYKSRVNVFYIVNKGSGLFKVVYNTGNKRQRYWKAFVHTSEDGNLVFDRYSISRKTAITVAAQVLELIDLYRNVKTNHNDL